MTQTMLELADDIADIPHEVNLTPRQARLLQEAATALRETAALLPSQEVPALIPAGKQARFKNETTWFAVGDWHNHPHSFEYRTVYALDDPAAQPQRMWIAPAEFVMWALVEGPWQGDNVGGGAAQDKARELGLIVATQYDPKKHGETAYCEPGDQWFVPSEALLAALSGQPGKPPTSHRGTQGEME